MFVIPRKRGQGEKNSSAKVTEEQVREIRKKDKKGVSQYVIAEEYGLSQPAVNHIVRKRTWSHVD